MPKLKDYPVGTRFFLDGKQYIKIPEMHLKGFGHKFVINVIEDVLQTDEWECPEKKAGYLPEGWNLNFTVLYPGDDW